MPTAEELFAEEAIREAYRRDDAVIFDRPAIPGNWIVPGSILRHVHMDGSFVCVRSGGGTSMVQREFTVNNPAEWLLVGQVKPAAGSQTRITTREAAIEEMLRWANGEKSHRAEILAETASEGSRSATQACALADFAEVQKWAAVAEALRDPQAPLSQRSREIIDAVIEKLRD